jgi:hypothetical protein
MIRWGDLKDNILAGIIKDPDEVRVSPDQLLVWAKWACVEVSYHTAQAVLKSFPCDGLINQFALPNNMIDSLEKTGLVAYNDGTSVNYLVPIRHHSGTLWPSSATAKDGQEMKGYWEWPTGQFTLGFIPVADTSIDLYYFKTWDAPVNDDSMLDIPGWMEHPFGYIVAAYALDPDGYQISNIRNWIRKQDAGKPEDNPPHKQAEYFLKQADRLLSRIAPQDRETFYRLETRSGVRK